MSNYSAFSRFKRSILGVGSRSVGVLPYLGKEFLYEDADGRIFVDTANGWWIKETSGRVYLNPDHSSGHVLLQSNGRMFVNTSIYATPFGLSPSDSLSLAPSETLAPSNTLAPH